MQLDQTHIVIRQRRLPELADLAVLLIQRYPRPLLLSWILGMMPLAIINGLLTGWMIWNDQMLQLVDDEAFANRARYIWDISVLVFLQMPLAGVYTTYFLGQAVFEERPPWRRVVSQVWRSAHRWIWTLGVVRGALPAMALMLLIAGSEFSPGVEGFLFVCLVIWAGCLRAMRPFAPEILLLERCRFRKGADADAITASKRSATLHGPASGDCVARFFGAIGIAILLAGILFYGLMFIRGVFVGRWNWNLTVFLVFYPLALWTSAFVMTIIRLLSYLDTRIRLEGWEVELMLRAEAARQRAALGEQIATPRAGARVTA